MRKKSQNMKELIFHKNFEDFFINCKENNYVIIVRAYIIELNKYENKIIIDQNMYL